MIFYLLRRTLKKSGLDIETTHVATLTELENALKSHDWDLVISDYHLLGYTAADVLPLVKAASETLPVIVLSGAVSEEEAADLMRLGARDFVRKG